MSVLIIYALNINSITCILTCDTIPCRYIMSRLISYVVGPAPFYVDETDLVIECPPEELGTKLAHYAMYRHQKTTAGAVMVATSVQIASDSSDVVLIPYNHLVDGFRIEPELPYSLVFGEGNNVVTIPCTDTLEQPEEWVNYHSVDLWYEFVVAMKGLYAYI